jgi:hypothetical protein
MSAAIKQQGNRQSRCERRSRVSCRSSPAAPRHNPRPGFRLCASPERRKHRSTCRAIGRTKTDGPADYEAVHKIQAGLKVTPISRFGQAVEPVVGTVDPGVDIKTPPKTQVDTMPAGKFFAYAAEVLKLQRPHITDEPILAQMRRIGIERGKSFDLDRLDPAIKTALETAPKDALALMAWKVNSMARVVNGWSMNTDTMGVYGNYYLKRAIVTQLGLGANLDLTNQRAAEGRLNAGQFIAPCRAGWCAGGSRVRSRQAHCSRIRSRLDRCSHTRRCYRSKPGAGPRRLPPGSGRYSWRPFGRTREIGERSGRAPSGDCIDRRSSRIGLKRVRNPQRRKEQRPPA